jgi:hypothetical protein
MQMTDELDKTTIYRFDVNVLANTPPVVIAGSASNTAVSGQTFSFTHISNLFTEVDAGDSIAFVTMSWGSSPIPVWMQYQPATFTYFGTAPIVSTTVVYNLAIWGYDT